jgi:ligand-binding sensor domain-containing protein
MKPFGRIVTILVLAVLAHRLPAEAQSRSEQAVTYRNFNFVKTISCSINYAYFVTTGGIIRYDKNALQWDQPLTAAEGLPTEPINQIWADRFDQILVIETDFGFYQYEDFFERWTPIGSRPAIENDSRHLAPPDVLMPQFDANYMGRGEFSDIYARTFMTTDIVDDGSGNLWLGTNGFGAAQADPHSGLMTLLPYGLLQNRVDIILPDDSVFWLAGTIDNDYRTGLTAFDPQANVFFIIESGLNHTLPAEDVYALEADSTYLYVGTPSGLYTVEKVSQIAEGPINHRYGLAEDAVLSLELAGRSLFIGTINGLNLIDLETDSVFHIRSGTFYQRPVFDLELVDSTIWIASAAGAYRYSFLTDRLQHFQDPDRVLFGSVFNVEQFENSVWLASDAGAVKLDLGTGKSESFPVSSGQREYRAMAVNDRILALSSDPGLVITFLDEDKPRDMRFTTADGLASDEVLSLRLDGDYLWVGTDSGLTRFLWNNPRWID